MQWILFIKGPEPNVRCFPACVRSKGPINLCWMRICTKLWLSTEHYGTSETPQITLYITKVQGLFLSLNFLIPQIKNTTHHLKLTEEKKKHTKQWTHKTMMSLILFGCVICNKGVIHDLPTLQIHQYYWLNKCNTFMALATVN